MCYMMMNIFKNGKNSLTALVMENMTPSYRPPLTYPLKNLLK